MVAVFLLTLLVSVCQHPILTQQAFLSHWSLATSDYGLP